MLNPYEMEKRYEQHIKELEHQTRTAYLYKLPKNQGKRAGGGGWLQIIYLLFSRA